MVKYAFQSIANTEVIGHLQAVSQQGDAIVYRTQDTFYLYYFTGQTFVTNTFWMGLTLRPVPQHYQEEADPYNDVHVGIRNSSILIYAIDYNRKKVGLQQYPNYGQESLGVVYEEYYEEILDSAIHPSKRHLAAMTPESVEFKFEEFNEDTQMLQMLSENVTIQTGRIFSFTEHHLATFQLFYVEQNNDVELQLYKVRKESELEEFQPAVSNEINIQVLSTEEFDEIYGVDYDQNRKIFGITNDYIDSKTDKRIRNHFFVTDELEKMTVKGKVGSEVFHSFVQGTDQMLMGRYTWGENKEELKMEAICLVDYAIHQKEIILGEKDCKQGYFDRVGIWTMDRKPYLITHLDRDLTVSNISSNLEEVATIPADAFSLKKDNYLIVEQDGDLNMMEWAELKEQINVVVVEPEEQHQSGYGGLVAGIVVLSVLVLLLLAAVVGMFIFAYKKGLFRQFMHSIGRENDEESLRQRQHQDGHHDNTTFIGNQTMNSKTAHEADP